MSRVTSADVRCPACGASPGQRCHRLDDDSRPTSPHAERLRRAREEQQRLNPEHVQGQLDRFPRKDLGPVVFVCSRRRGSARG